MICDKWEEENFPARCTVEVAADPANMFTPNDFAEW